MDVDAWVTANAVPLVALLVIIIVIMGIFLFAAAQSKRERLDFSGAGDKQPALAPAPGPQTSPLQTTVIDPFIVTWRYSSEWESSGSEIGDAFIEAGRGKAFTQELGEILRLKADANLDGICEKYGVEIVRIERGGKIIGKRGGLYLGTQK